LGWHSALPGHALAQQAQTQTMVNQTLEELE
jgi:hypothetical protein